jgi:hypothetical protein
MEVPLASGARDSRPVVVPSGDDVGEDCGFMFSFGMNVLIE